VDGSGFIGTSTVDWNGTALPTTYISAAQLTAQVPASDIANVGSATVTVVNPALGGGSSGALNFTISSAMSSGPKLMQFMTQQTTSNNTENQAVVQFSANTTAGNAIWVAVTVSDFDGPHMITVTDTQGNTFTQLDQENDPAPGEQTVAHFYAPHIVGDNTTPDTITVSLGNDDYKGVLITEIGGLTSAPLVRSPRQPPGCTPRRERHHFGQHRSGRRKQPGTVTRGLDEYQRRFKRHRRQWLRRSRRGQRIYSAGSVLGLRRESCDLGNRHNHRYQWRRTVQCARYR
jgi:hypothetical protein